MLVAKGGRVGDYIICVIKNKICILGINAEATKAACEYFLANIAAKSAIDQKLCYLNIAESASFSTVKLGDTEKLAQYVIVRKKYNISYIEQLGIEKIQSVIAEKTGYVVNIVKDSVTSPQTHEIILGNAVRDGVETLSNYENYSIKVSGTKVYLNGGNTYSRAMAATEFAKQIEAGTNMADGYTAGGDYKTAVAAYGEDFYKLKFGDDFDGSALDTNIWTTSGGFGSAAANGKKQALRSLDNLAVRDGNLIEVATFDEDYYYGAWIQSGGHMSAKYGYFEISAILPSGGGLWTGFWTRNPGEPTGNSVQEIDIFECFGPGNVIASTMHRWPTKAAKAGRTKEEIEALHTSTGRSFSSQSKHYLDKGETYSDTYHTIGYLWTGDSGTFTVDGEPYYKYVYGTDPKATLEEDIDAFDEDQFYLIISLACGFDNNASKPDDSADYWNTTNKYIVDYCQIFQDSKGIINFQ